MKSKKKSPISLNPLSGTNGQLMALAAFRYCLGRLSYIPDACRRWLADWWDEIDDETKQVIIRDIVESLQDNTAGDSFDTESWKRFAKDKFDSLTTVSQEWVRGDVAHRNKPWPLD